MKTRSAILQTVPGEYQVAEIELDEPRDGELMVKMAASGLCHSDDHIAQGDMPFGTIPVAGGHEGSGVVVEVGAGVRGFAEGDHVVFSFLPSCGKCRWCASGMQNLCDLGSTLLMGSRLDDTASFRMSFEGRSVGQMAGLGTFSEYTTVDVNSAVKIPNDMPLDIACLLGCSVGTGWGSAVNLGRIRIGDTVIVMGVGGVGINAVQGAAHAGASYVVAVDPLAFKREAALKLGATHAFDNVADATALAQSVTNGQGADAAIVTVGITTAEHVAQACASIRKGGTVVVTGLGHASDVLPPIPLSELVLMQKNIQGCLFGGCAPSSDILRQIELYKTGSLKLDELVTKRYTLDQVAQGFKDMHAGEVIRGVIVHD
jgi:NDMA-dependent alcohol dehydrogenase